jgi:hypothetical protein
MKHLILATFLFASTLVFSQDYNYRLWLVNSDDKSLDRTYQTYDIIDYGDSIIIKNPALSISFNMIGSGVLIPSAKITFADDIIECPIEYYEEYPRWIVIIFKPIDAPEARYWFHWDHFLSSSPFKTKL